MNVLIYGANTVGICLGASLLDRGFNITFIDKGETKAAIEEKGIVRTGLFKYLHFYPSEFKCYESCNEINEETFDYILICSKPTNNFDIASDLNDNRDILQTHGKIIIFQTGLNVDKEFLNYFSKDDVFLGIISTDFIHTEKHISEATISFAPILIGSLYGSYLFTLHPLADALDNSNIPCHVTNDISKALWSQLIYNCALNPLSAILKVNYGELASCENSVFLMNKIIEEIFKVMIYSGNETYWSTAEEYKNIFYNELIPAICSHKSSTLQDIERGHKTEIDTLTGSIVELGNELCVAVPYNTMVYNLIKSIENKF